MFTGIVTGIGRASLNGRRLSVELPDGWLEDEPLRSGESIAIDGTCLTVLPESSATTALFDLSEETLKKTATGRRERVHLERALRAMDRLGGHLVQGHVDGIGEVIAVRDTEDGGRTMTVRVPHPEFLVDKGSVTLDGVSLTIVDLRDEDTFDLWLISHTLAMTTLAERRAGDPLNVEHDATAKMVVRFLEKRGYSPER